MKIKSFCKFVMMDNLIDLKVGILLDKFGEGKPTPGSGSAAALQGLLSAQLICTVIKITNKSEHREKYDKFISELLRIQNLIDTRIYNRLLILFQFDSEKFDLVIELIKQRNKEQNPLKKNEIASEVQEALLLATEITLEIAELCLELVGFANYTFEYAYRAVRGDSGVALNGAISAVAGCLSIVDLNLISLYSDERLEKIMLRKLEIKSKVEILSKRAIECQNLLEQESNENHLYHQSISEFKIGNLANSVTSNSDIEKIVRQLQNTLWLNQDKIWKNKTLEHHIEVLKPDIVFKNVLNYAYLQPESLGSYVMDNGTFEIAGLIDKQQKIVQVANKFPKEVQNFTAAHELGHAILHGNIIMHRDRPIDGSTIPKSIEEIQANKFAAYFLMPSSLVKSVFFKIFELRKFVINENTVAAISPGSTTKAFRDRCKDIHGLGVIIATTEYYSVNTFKSLSEIFGVSKTTMAIRLEELGLLEY